MKTTTKVNSPFLTCALFTVVVLISGCNSNPSISSSSGIPSGTPTGTPSSSPSTGSSSSSGTSGSSGTGSQQGGIGSPGSPFPQGQQGQGQSSTAGTESGQGSSSTQAGSGQQGNKTDDQILAEALEEFGKRPGQSEGQGNTEGQNSGTNSTENQSGTQGNGSSTDSEKAEDLNKELNEKFAKFDNLILGEREAGRREGYDEGSGAGGYGSGEGDSGSGNEPLQTAMTEPPMSGGGSLGSKKSGSSVSYEPPTDVGNGQDDDIIARQLREAAMKEQDPELRAKLWDEYRKYKKGS